MVEEPEPLPLAASAIQYLKPETIVIGLSGPLSSGCSTVAKYLSKKHKFQLVRLSDIIRQGFTNPTAKDLQDKGDELRKKNGAATLVEMAFRKLLKDAPEKIVIDGIRNPGEIKYLRRFSNFFLIGLDASRQERLRRYRIKTGENISDRAFFEIDERDSGKGQPAYGQDVTRCIDLADFQIINNESWDSDLNVQDLLFKKADVLLSLIEEPGSKRPSIREIGMHIAYSASLMSPCLKRQVGATVTRAIENTEEELAVAVGYNRPPEGVPNCYSRFRECYRDSLKTKLQDKIKSEAKELKAERATELANIFLAYPEIKRLDYCQSIHAEESAILQVAKLGGTSLNGTNLYSTTFPCLLCAKVIIQTGISKIIYNEAYPIEEAWDLLAKRLGEKNLIRFEGVKSLAFFKLFQQNENGKRG